ncbi:acyltransferase family protein [Dielma fastidiosa]|uniref:Peptidoglycan/LPS O-acetylase OafA/YrhL n=1 Tax=Dielma fastidiosa TaxID=1034346 RepID=A0A318L3U9_9FIRM|nr:acyltransferase family protein [Dielma fastidiosa]PXX80133.1 peptidoglycan/LPS O-acetylase OafA/YrhL [Dielma fastidiosa]
MNQVLQPKKTRNYAVDFWRVFATLAVCWGHFGSVGFRFAGGSHYPASTLFTNGPVLGVFLIFTGYFLMKSFQSKKAKGMNSDKSARVQAIEYLKSRYIGLWPALFTGVAFGFVISITGELTGLWHGKLLTVGEHFNGITDIFAALNVSILQFLGLDATGLLSDTGFAYSWNSPLWYISAIFVGGYFLYYCLAKNEDFTRGFIIPAIVIICPSVWAMNSALSMNDRSVLFLGLFDNAIAFGSWGMALGILLYQPYERFRKMKIGNIGKKWLTVIHVLFAGWLFYITIVGFDGLYASAASDGGRINSEMYVNIIVAITLAFAVANQDYLTEKIFNRPIFGKLGEFALYYFIVHIHVINVVLGLVGGENVTTSGQYYMWLIIVNIICIILGLIAQQFCKKVISPLLKKLDNNIQRCTQEGIAEGIQ